MIWLCMKEIHQEFISECRRARPVNIKLCTVLHNRICFLARYDNMLQQRNADLLECFIQKSFVAGQAVETVKPHLLAAIRTCQHCAFQFVYGSVHFLGSAAAALGHRSDLPIQIQHRIVAQILPDRLQCFL